MDDEQKRKVIEAFDAVKRFADHCEERNISVPLWAGLLWENALLKISEARAMLDDA